MSTQPGVTMQAGRVDLAPRRALDLADLDDAVAVDGDVADEGSPPVPSTMVPSRMIRSCTCFTLRKWLTNGR